MDLKDTNILQKTNAKHFEIWAFNHNLQILKNNAYKNTDTFTDDNIVELCEKVISKKINPDFPIDDGESVSFNLFVQLKRIL